MVCYETHFLEAQEGTALGQAHPAQGQRQDSHLTLSPFKPLSHTSTGQAGITTTSPTREHLMIRNLVASCNHTDILICAGLLENRWRQGRARRLQGAENALQKEASVGLRSARPSPSQAREPRLLPITPPPSQGSGYREEL